MIFGLDNAVGFTVERGHHGSEPQELTTCVVTGDDSAANREIDLAEALLLAEFNPGLRDREQYRLNLRRTDVIAMVLDATACIAVGTMNVRRNVGRVKALTTEPSYRELGLGSLVLGVLEGVAAHRQATRVELTSMAGVESFYLKRGYEPKATYSGAVAMGKNIGQ